MEQKFAPRFNECGKEQVEQMQYFCALLVLHHIDWCIYPYILKASQGQQHVTHE